MIGYAGGNYRNLSTMELMWILVTGSAVEKVFWRLLDTFRTPTAQEKYLYAR
jgi:hypothetical protein